ncbi:uncharacterized protein LOC126833309 [Adelges cooleyi]|uniref:uncharacterized protein LOC126833309 n=1 Tax=Adelges cooleyi TaxID=133065 RepID=UPI0021804A7F|nr:uncharacterized protein LOC126833309 [Adelges cooleyi]
MFDFYNKMSIRLISLLCLIFSFTEAAVQDNRDKIKDCSLSVPDKDVKLMPIAFVPNGRKYHIIYPDDKGALNVRYGHNFKLACVGNNTFAAVAPTYTEILVTCAGGNNVTYRGQRYRYGQFKCQQTPKSVLKLTGDKCQTNHSLVTVGFQTKWRHLTMLKICFDTTAKNSLYTWYAARSPYHDYHQYMKSKPSFVNSRELYGTMNVNKFYTLKEQKKTVAKILGSEEQMEKYYTDSEHSLSRGHFAARADFALYVEQYATYYYANVAPQWQVFNGKLWSQLENHTRLKLSNDSSRYVIVTGTYGVCTLEDVDGEQQPIHLDPPYRLPVPLYYWKLVYNVDDDDGTVYLGLNNPFMNITDDVYICPNTCPDGYEGNDANDGLVYCCSKEEFEKVYGELDKTLFEK